MLLVKGDEGKTFTPPPEDQYLAVCCDVVDLGLVDTSYKGVAKVMHKMFISFLLDKDRDDGKPFMVSSRFTVSLNEKGRLLPFLQSWFGRKLTSKEIKDGIDLEEVIGNGALLSIVHNKVGDRTYANIQSIMKPPKGSEIPAIRDYTRVKDRPKAGENGHGEAGLEDD